MGVRFQCPSGHKLHVKAELAGKRGICPECGAKFVVPSFSGGRAAADAPTDSVFIQTQTPPPMAPPQATVQSPAAATIDEPIAWYVRPPDGGQFGPATTEVFHEWIEAGRVAVDSWVWRTGWTDWKPGGEALAQIADRPSLQPGASIAALLDPLAAAADVSATGTSAHIEPGSAEARRAEIKRRKQRVRKISTLLALIALAMLMALVFVLAR